MAWALVYRRYKEQGLIDENPFRIHTVPQAIDSHACVICEILRGTVVSTLTVIADHTGDLPLDSVYGESLNSLREEGCAIVEVGLLADRRRAIQRTAAALFDMMRWVAYYTLHFGRTDIVIGVHPHHVGFYGRCFGFEAFAPPTMYPLVNDNPVVPLRLPLRDRLAQPSLPPGLRHVRNNPVPAEAFAERFRFDPQALQGSRIERFFKKC